MLYLSCWAFKHTIAPPYCLEDYISGGLKEEKKGCTEYPQVFNQPNQRLNDQPADEVMHIWCGEKDQTTFYQ